MIKPIVLLLVGGLGLSLLDQSNAGVRQTGANCCNPCSKFVYYCLGEKDGVKSVYASFCVPFHQTLSGSCVPKFTSYEVVEKCAEQLPPKDPSENSAMDFSDWMQSRTRC